MPIKPSRRLPKNLRRTVSPQTRRLVEKKHGKHRRHWSEHMRRVSRNVSKSITSWKVASVRALLVSFCIVTVLVVWFFGFSRAVHIQEITVARTSSRLDIEQVQRILAPLFGRHLLFVSDREVKELLYERLYDIESISVNTSFPSRLSVQVDLQPLIARLNILSPDGQQESGTGSTIDFLTDEGIYVVSLLEENSDPLFSLDIVDWGIRPDPGSELVHSEMMQMLQRSERVLTDQFGFQILRRTLFLRGQEIHFTVDRGFTLWFDMDALEEQLQRLKIFLANVPLEEVKEYVDLRVTERVVYR